MSAEEFVRMENITKTFPGVIANDDVSMSVKKGEIHGLLGENGAGKSTLMKILYGLYSADQGEIWLGNNRLEMDSPQDAIDAGIGMVHQHFKLIPRLSVSKNIILGKREPTAAFREDHGAKSGVLGSLTSNNIVQSLASRFTLGLDAPQKQIQQLSDNYGFDIDVTVPVWELGVGERQRVEILKALYRDVDLLILDEPTAVLTPTQAERLFETLEKLTNEGLTVIIITHKLDEIKQVTDRVTVLRDGKDIGTVETSEQTSDDLARMMVGRDVLFEVDKDDVPVGETVLDVSSLRTEDDRGIEAVSGVDMSIKSGEIVGLAGVSGNGQKELAESLVGVRETVGGSIEITGDDITDEPPSAFINSGVSFVPEDRHKDGCAGTLSIMHNAVMKRYSDSEFSDGFTLNYQAMEEYADTLVKEFDVRGISDVREINAGELSGGNLQKLILAREMLREPDLLVANQPTRGVDVGAIEFIRERLVEQRKSGTGVLLLSEDLDELFDLSDRILVIYQGEIVYETTPEEADRQRISLEMNGGKEEVKQPAQIAADGGRSNLS
uniref:Signal-transducing histidine kinase; response regulator n=1 Tax=uncultured haloarchaeon TaxID=160804 RepID=Q2LGY0_9EURY|nr:signal-transducing histidine kinase; response regulator [uncultured haloarchaeon]